MVIEAKIKNSDFFFWLFQPDCVALNKFLNINIGKWGLKLNKLDILKLWVAVAVEGKVLRNIH